MTARNAADAYITPPDAVEALRLWLHGGHPTAEALATGHLLEPFSGPGAIPLWLHRTGGPWTLMEIRQDLHAASLRYVNEALERFRVDSLHYPWPRADIITNPPFNRLLEVLLRVVEHVEDNRGDAIVLHDLQWPYEPGTNDARLGISRSGSLVSPWLRPAGLGLTRRDLHHRRRPDLVLVCGWRLRFLTAKPGGKKPGSFSRLYAWHVYLRGHAPSFTQLITLEQPTVSDDAWRVHAEMAALAARPDERREPGDEHTHASGPGGRRSRTTRHLGFEA